jgi:hypothetical protein
MFFKVCILTTIAVSATLALLTVATASTIITIAFDQYIRPLIVG